MPISSPSDDDMTEPELSAPADQNTKRSMPTHSLPNESSPQSPAFGMASQLSSSAKVGEDGSLDLLGSVGGVRGLVESILPSAVFLFAFIVTDSLWGAGISAATIAAVFSAVRLAQRQSPMQAITGFAGVALCVVVALLMGDATEYYLPGFFTNAAYAVALIISMFIKWPLVGLIFGFIRGEGTDWRSDPARRWRYQIATALLVAMFLSRLAVQLPLYWADELIALGTARLIMGVPLYAMALWLAWLVSQPSRSNAV